MYRTRVMHLLTGLIFLAMVATGCGTLTGAAIGAGTGNVGRGALIGAGVGAAAGALYDVTRPYPRYSAHGSYG